MVSATAVRVDGLHHALGRLSGKKGRVVKIQQFIFDWYRFGTIQMVILPVFCMYQSTLDMEFLTMEYSTFCEKVKALEYAIFNPATTTTSADNLQEDLNDVCEDNPEFTKLFDRYTKYSLTVPADLWHLIY